MIQESVCCLFASYLLISYRQSVVFGEALQFVPISTSRVAVIEAGVKMKRHSRVAIAQINSGLKFQSLGTKSRHMQDEHTHKHSKQTV